MPFTQAIQSKESGTERSRLLVQYLSHIIPMYNSASVIHANMDDCSTCACSIYPMLWPCFKVMTEFSVTLWPVSAYMHIRMNYCGRCITGSTRYHTQQEWKLPLLGKIVLQDNCAQSYHCPIPTADALNNCCFCNKLPTARNSIKATYRQLDRGREDQ